MLLREEEIELPGYPKEKLIKKQQEIEERSIPLHVCPKRPNQSLAPNQENANKYLDLISRGLKSPLLRQVAEKAIANVQYISMEKFDAALKECVMILNNKLQELENPQFAVGAISGSSNLWIASLALKDLVQLPYAWFPLKSNQDQGTIDLNIKEVKENTIVLFDDGSYSKQGCMSSIGTKITDSLQEMAKQLKESEQLSPKKVLIVIPFITSYAHDLISKCQTSLKDQLDIELITCNERLKLIKEIFETPQEQDNMQKLTNGKAEDHLTLAYTDWQKKDDFFVPGFGGSGMQYPINLIEQSDEWDTVKMLGKGGAFIPDIG